MPAKVIPRINKREESLIILFLLWVVKLLFCRALKTILSGAELSNMLLCIKLAQISAIIYIGIHVNKLDFSEGEMVFIERHCFATSRQLI